MAWYHTFNDIFWISIAGLFFAFLGTLLKSKCTKFSCCGIVIERDTRAEERLERAAIERVNNNHQNGIPLPSSLDASPIPMSPINRKNTSNNLI